MVSETALSRLSVAWGVATRALPGQTFCGDLHLVKPLGDRVLLAAVDGLGHGEEATVAAKLAVSTLDLYASEPVVSLFQRCHAALKKTRGVVMTLASLEPRARTLTWLGVGNVEGQLLRTDAGSGPGTHRAILRNGLVGFVLPELRAETVPIAPGDQIVFVTDGIAAGFAAAAQAGLSPQQMADSILERHFKGTDDALVLVARYLGGGDA